MFGWDPVLASTDFAGSNDDDWPPEAGGILLRCFPSRTLHLRRFLGEWSNVSTRGERTETAEELARLWESGSEVRCAGPQATTVGTRPTK